MTTLTDPEGQALVALGIAVAARAGKTWDPPGTAAAVRKLAEQGDRPSTILAKLETAAADPNARTPDAALWTKFGNARPRANADDPAEPVCVHCRHTREGCARAQALVPPAQRFAHEFTTRSGTHEPRPTRLRPSERTPDALDDVGGPS
ncbi:hypothetical protein J4N02_08320 [Propioniciclava sp. MC1595]|uniref:hypothetical protein n=1 Tax=unclassified Propioniciclava TaxID=2642922 RepID=UPI0015FEF790|nr:MULTISPECIES: hypothetical protein [unclassified Propioniciclava]MBB1495889.1 hypothetical protein [Propioniciclava sp. MC1595]MBB1500616.1 hypothetical protein [Propioniciclava sp. MC1683]QTE24605.1 hypothetical protein J4N02_08320 [Propioniciclava sp. MC1595]